MSLKFNLSNELTFENYEVLNYERNKNSPSSTPLRGKGSLFSAENFSYNDSFNIKIILKNKKNINEFNQLTKLKYLYSLYRTKGFVFLENKTIYQQVYPAVDLINSQNMISTALKTLNNSEKILSKEEYDKYQKEIELFLININAFKDIEQFYKAFPNPKNFNIKELLNKAKTTNKYYPLLTCLEKIDIQTIPDSSDGYLINLRISVVKDQFKFDSKTIDLYKKRDQEFNLFYNEIKEQLLKYQNSNQNLIIKCLDYTSEKLYIQKTQKTTNDQIVKSGLNEIILEINKEDISQMQLISYNNIANIPLQSSVLKQYLGVGQTHLTIKLLFKNSLDSNFQKLKHINELLNKEQRKLKSEISFPFVNSFDLYGLEFSDFFYSNDEQTNGVFATLILKLSSYKNGAILFNKEGNYINETLINNNKNKTANLNNYYSAFANFNYNLMFQNINEINKIKIDTNSADEFDYQDLINSYYYGSDIHLIISQMNIRKFNLGIIEIDPQKLFNLFNSFNNISEFKDKKILDMVGILPMMNLLNSYSLLYLFRNNIDKKLNKKDYQSILKKENNQLYNDCFYYIVSSMFPEATYEEEDYFTIETLKLLLLDLLSSLSIDLLEYLDKNKINSTFGFESIKEKKEIIIPIINNVFSKIKDKIDSEDFLQKCITTFNLNKVLKAKEFSENAEVLTIETITKKIGEAISKIKIDLNKYNSSNFSVAVNNLANLIITINSLRTIGFNKEFNYNTYKNKINDYTNNPLGNFNEEEYNKIFQESIYYFQYIDLITLASLSFLMSSYGMSNTYFGFIADTASREVVNIGIKAKSLLLSSMKESEEIDSLLIELFGSEFISKDGAQTFYNPLTSNISLTDLGSYFGIYPKDNNGEFKIIFEYLMNNMDLESPSRTARTQYFDLLKKFSEDFLKNDNETKKILENLYINLRKNTSDENKKIEIEKIQKEYNDSLLGNNVINNLYDTFYNNKINFSQNFNSVDLRQKRIESLLLPLTNIEELNKLMSPNFTYTIPTYDIYVLKKELFYNASTYGTTERIENFLGLDKLISLKVTFSELTRTKTAILEFLDSSENLNQYDFKIKNNLNQSFDILDKEAINDSNNDFYLKQMQEIQIGDSISIHMGYMNENKLIFNGIIKSIEEGKIKRLICTNYTYELTNRTFDLNLSYNNSIVDMISTMSRIWTSTTNKNFHRFENAKKTSQNINSHFIFSDFKNINFNHINNKNEQLSNYNLCFYGLSQVLDDMVHFTESNNMKLSKMLQNSVQWNQLDLSDFVFRPTRESLLNNIVENINNIDRDAGFYGIRIKEKEKMYFSQGSTNYKTELFLEEPKSTFIPDNIINDVRYQRDNINMHQLLNDIEKRSPGTFWNVYDSGFTNTLFLGRKDYNIKLKDCKSEFEFNKTDSNKFLELFNQNKEELINLDLIQKYNFLYSLVGSIIGNINPEDSLSLTNSTNFNNDYKKATNIVYVSTNKNLISNKIIINNEVANKIKLKFDATLVDRIKGLVRNWQSNSIDLYSFASLKDAKEEEEKYRDRIKEKLIEDSNIRGFQQALESAQSRLQIELENYYKGKIIILFNPEIQYRTELVINDSTNQIHGSVLVKEFEHVFDQRGSYTIITPMMKIEPLNIAKDTFNISFWTRLFYDKNAEETDANKKLNSLKSYLKENNDNTSLLFDIINHKITQTPVVFGNVCFKLNKNNKYDSLDLKTAGIQPLCFYPLLKRKKYLLPDIDIYNQQQNKYFEGLSNWFVKLKAKTETLFSMQKTYIDVFDRNIGNKIWTYLRNRAINLFSPNKSYIDKLNIDSVIGIKNGNDIEEYIFDSVKKVILKDLHSIYNQNTLPINQFANKNSFAFYNTKIFSLISSDEKKRNIATIISNFDCISLVELADILPNGKKGGTEAINKLSKELLEILKANQLDYEITEPVLIRKDSMTINENKVEGQADEYSITFYRKQNKNLLNHFIIKQSGIKEINVPIKLFTNNQVNEDLINQTTNIRINIPRFKIKIFRGNKSYEFNMYVFHNIYYSQSLHLESYRMPARRNAVNSLLEVISKDRKPSIIFGDFNISMFKYTTNSNKIYAPVLGEVLQLDELGTSDLTAKSNGFIPLINPSTLTTLGTIGDKNSFENILINEDFQDIVDSKRFNINYGIYYEAKLENNKYTREYLSDHYPSYFIFNL